MPLGCGDVARTTSTERRINSACLGQMANSLDRVSRATQLLECFDGEVHLDPTTAQVTGIPTSRPITLRA